MEKEGEIRLLSLGELESRTKAEFGAVSDWVLLLAQPGPAPLEETFQPAGNAGGVTPSKLSDKIGRLLRWPSVKENVTAPRFAVPSCNWSVAEIALQLQDGT